MRVGVLALQGCIEPHLNLLKSLGVVAVQVRAVAELESADRIIIPGGESTTMLKLLHSTGLFSALIKFAQTKPVWGICAGAIVIAKEVSNPTQESLELINIHAHRNHYGSQLNSFEAEVNVSAFDSEIKAQFIRAPLLTSLSPLAKVIAHQKETPVLFQQDRILAGSFHVELGEDPRLHKYFLEI